MELLIVSISHLKSKLKPIEILPYFNSSLRLSHPHFFQWNLLDWRKLWNIIWSRGRHLRKRTLRDGG